MERYVLRYRGPSAPSDQLDALRRRVKVLDSSPKLLLVETNSTEAESLKTDFPQWLIAPEVTHFIPEKPIRPRKPPR